MEPVRPDTASQRGCYSEAGVPFPPFDPVAGVGVGRVQHAVDYELHPRNVQLEGPDVHFAGAVGVAVLTATYPALIGGRSRGAIAGVDGGAAGEQEGGP